MVYRFRRWQFLTRFDIPSRDGTQLYMTRWRIVQTPWFGIFLHRINLPDTDKDMHDHPWPFVSLVLRGGYDEERPFMGGWKLDEPRRWLSIGFRRATDLHRIVSLHRKPTWTLVLAGRYKRPWGFMTPTGWVHYREYLGI